MDDYLIILQILSYIIAAVWVVSSIKNTTERLSMSIEHLALVVDELKKERDEQKKEQNHIRESINQLRTEHAGRLTVLETLQRVNAGGINRESHNS